MTLNAPIIEIQDEDFGIWYMDCQDRAGEIRRQDGAFSGAGMPDQPGRQNSFVPGRFAMTCCVQDIQFVGFPCVYDGYKALEQRSWITLTAKVGYKFHNIYRGKGPVLTHCPWSRAQSLRTTW